MAYSPSVLRRAKDRLAQEKANHEADYAARMAAAYEKYPELLEIDRQLRTTLAQVVAATFRAGQDPGPAIAAIREQNLQLQRRREWILSDYDESLIVQTPICPPCGGSGYVGSKCANVCGSCAGRSRRKN